MTERSMSRTGGGAGGLGANQIRWLRTNMKPFDDAWKAVQASDAHARRIRAQLQTDPPRPNLTQQETAADAPGGAVQRLHLVERRPRRRGIVPA